MQAQLVKTLIENPALFSTSKLEVKETHISWVLITDEFVYKIKKAVNFGFLNFETLQDRKKYCELEIELNRNMGADFYEKVVSISGDANNPLIDDNSNPIEYAVKMRKFDATQELSYLEQKDQLSAIHILQLMQKLADWHAKAPVITEKNGGLLGTPNEVEKPVLDNFDLILNNIDDKQAIADVELIKNWAKQVFDKNLDLLQKRYDTGMVRSCHGDLHLANVVVYQEQVTPFDCIEFNLEFRYIDVINDLAFLLMDLDAKNRMALSNLALNRYLELTGDYQSLPLLNYYKSYRAMVRAKVNLLQMMQAQTQTAKDEAYQNFLQYVNLAKSYTLTKIPHLILISGVSGSGKSTLAGKITKANGALHLSSDIERKRLFGLKENESSQSATNGGIYTKKANIETYAKLEEFANLLLKNGFSVVLDATFMKIEHRERFVNLAKNLGLLYLLIGFDIDSQESKNKLFARIEARMQEKDKISEANTEVLQRQLANYERFTQEELQKGIVLEVGAEKALADVLHLINKLGIN